MSKELEEAKRAVVELIRRTASAPDSQDAMRFSQSACNVANAICALRSAAGI